MNPNPLQISHKTASLLAVPVVAVLVSLVVWSYAGPSSERQVSQEVQEEVYRSAFESLDIKARSVYVYDARTREVLYAKNENLRLPLASVTKVMSALVATETPPQGDVVVSELALSTYGDSGLFKGERWALKDILDFSLTSSSNDGMQAVATSLGAFERADATAEEKEEDFVTKMNKKAGELDMKNTYFFNATGLDESEIQGGAYGTAKDITFLFDHVLRYYPSLLEATKDREVVVLSLDNHLHRAKNTGLNISSIPGVKASKTGFTGIAGGNLVVAFDPELGRPIIVAVLGSTASERFTDVLALVEASMKEITK